jgi:hypothetical protein
VSVLVDWMTKAPLPAAVVLSPEVAAINPTVVRLFGSANHHTPRRCPPSESDIFTTAFSLFTLPYKPPVCMVV